MPYFVVSGFDKWVRVRSGLSNAKIAAALSVDEATVQFWRDGEAIPDPATTLAPLRVAVTGPWPPATAEEVWQELNALIQAALAGPEQPKPERRPEDVPRRSTEVIAPAVKKKPAPPKTDPMVEAVKAEIDAALEDLKSASQGAEPISAGWFTRNSEKFKKYLPNRDFPHRKAFLASLLSRSDAMIQKAQSRRSDLVAALDRLSGALKQFDHLQENCTDLMRKPENAEMGRELKRAAPLVSMARQNADKARSKTLPTLDAALKQMDNVANDWRSKHDGIKEPAGVTLSWVSRNSRLVERLKALARLEEDPFEGLIICKDKLADHYKTGRQHNNAEKPVEIDLSSEIDLLVATPEQRRQAAEQARQS